MKFVQGNVSKQSVVPCETSSIRVALEPVIAALVPRSHLIGKFPGFHSKSDRLCLDADRRVSMTISWHGNLQRLQSEVNVVLLGHWALQLLRVLLYCTSGRGLSLLCSFLLLPSSMSAVALRPT